MSDFATENNSQRVPLLRATYEQLRTELEAAKQNREPVHNQFYATITATVMLAVSTAVLYGIDNLIISCQPDNDASKDMLAIFGVFTIVCAFLTVMSTLLALTLSIKVCVENALVRGLKRDLAQAERSLPPSETLNVSTNPSALYGKAQEVEANNNLATMSLGAEHQA